MSDKPTAPVVNINGTSAKNLLEEYRAAGHALRTAIEAVSAMTVHGRDFQTAPEGLYQKARAEQVERLRKLQDVLKEVEAMHMAVYEQE
jgi:hypothetical protein